MANDESQIRQMLAEREAGFRAKNPEQMVAHYAPGVVRYSLAPPLRTHRHRGVPAAQFDPRADELRPPVPARRLGPHHPADGRQGNEPCPVRRRGLRRRRQGVHRHRRRVRAARLLRHLPGADLALPGVLQLAGRHMHGASGFPVGGGGSFREQLMRARLERLLSSDTAARHYAEMFTGLG
jgi:hypothetical protein